MRFIVDAQLPAALARAIAVEGYVAQHVNDVAPGNTSDGWIWDYALRVGAAIISKDSDFPELVILRDQSPQVVWIRIGNTRKQPLLNWFLPQLASVVSLLESGTPVIDFGRRTGAMKSVLWWVGSKFLSFCTW